MMNDGCCPWIVLSQDDSRTSYLLIEPMKMLLEIYASFAFVTNFMNGL